MHKDGTQRSNLNHKYLSLTLSPDSFISVYAYICKERLDNGLRGLSKRSHKLNERLVLQLMIIQFTDV